MTTLPDRIGRYEVLSLLGQGGMGVLYLARDPVIDRHVALKLLKVDNDDLRRRFVREARSAGRLQHPNIVTVYDVGDHDGELFIAMEYIDGDTLATLIRDDVPFSTLRKLEMLDQLADGLGFAHNRGIIHRDIKPANLMVTRGGLLKVLDFGIARIARREMAAASMAGSLIGTPAYMAPEQLEGEVVDHRADIFAVGLVMYELLSGKRAFTGATTAEILQSVMRTEPVPLNTLVPHIDVDLVRCVNRALAKRPDDRYQGLQELRNDIGRVRRRSEYESGSFDATIVVQLPPQTRGVPSPAPPAPTAPASSAVSVPVPVPVPAPASALAVPPPLPDGPVTARKDGTSPPAPRHGGVEPGTRLAHDDEGEVLRHFASGAGRTTRPVVVPPNIDETVYAVATPARPQTREPERLSDADAPTVVVPAFSPGGQAPGAFPLSAHADASAPSIRPEESRPFEPPTAVPEPPARRSVLPALIALAVVVVMLVVITMGALWWVKSVFAGREEAPVVTDAVAEPAKPLPDVSTAPAPVVTDTTASPPQDPAAVSSTIASPPPAAEPSAARATPSVSPAQVSAAPAPERAAVPQPRPASPPASQQALTRPVSDTGVPRPAADVPPPPAPPIVTAPVAAPVGERDAPAPADVPRDEALVLVRAYVAARNTAHAAGIRRVWPTVSDTALRRMTGEFSAPLTLTDCDVDTLGAGRARATCRFTQPGSTGFSGGTALSVRRQLVFDVARQGRGWVIANVEG